VDVRARADNSPLHVTWRQGYYEPGQ
jgi:hypothetical protein